VKVLVTGRGGSGSWKIRGEQLGQSIGASVLPNTNMVDAYDLVVVVKHPRQDLVSRLHVLRKKIVWDVVDAFPQPHQSRWKAEPCHTREQAMAWLRSEIARIRPAGIVAATQAMAQDCAEFGIPVITLPHHPRPGQEMNPIRDKIRCVGYEGSEQYLGRWRRVLERECDQQGWVFAVNPRRGLCALDIVVAVRESLSYPDRHWKSNVKLANAQGTGTPIICGREAGYLETKSGGEIWADTEDELLAGIDLLKSPDFRRLASDALYRGQPKLHVIAQQYREWLAALKS
jgi:hypothetical protein